METLPSYETPFEDELLIASPAGDIRISDCSMNKFFLRQLISNMSRISLRMTDSDREALSEVLTSDALDHYAEQLFSEPEPPRTEVRVEAAAAVPEIARAKKAALADLQPKPIDIPEEVEWLSHPACQQAERNVESCGVGRAGENSRAGNARRRACQPD